jgi:hypothetical protein
MHDGKITFHVEDGYEHLKIILCKRDEYTYWIACLSSNNHWGARWIKALHEEVAVTGFIMKKPSYWVLDYDKVDYSYRTVGKASDALHSRLMKEFGCKA